MSYVAISWKTILNMRLFSKEVQLGDMLEQERLLDF